VNSFEGRTATLSGVVSQYKIIALAIKDLDSNQEKKYLIEMQ
jgi:hypothetical protein